MEWNVAPDPPRVGPATFSFSLADSAGHPVEGAQVQLEANMSHAGMRPVFAQAEEGAPGRYSAPLEFTMGGDWFILIDAALPDGEVVQWQVSLRGVRSE